MIYFLAPEAEECHPYQHPITGIGSEESLSLHNQQSNHNPDKHDSLHEIVQTCGDGERHTPPFRAFNTDSSFRAAFSASFSSISEIFMLEAN